MDNKADPTNPILIETIDTLKEQDASLWHDVAENLGKVNRQRPEVNLSDIERNTEEGDTVVVPGKLLGAGRLTKDVTVAAFQASNSAKTQVGEQGSFMFIQELIEENPEAENVKVIK